MSRWCDAIAPLLILTLVSAITSGYTVLTEATLASGTSPVVFAFLRDLVALALFIPALVVSETWSRRRCRSRATESDAPVELWPRREHGAYFVLLALLGVFGGQLCGAISISYLSASLYGLLTPTVPAFALIVGYAVGFETFRIREASSWLKLLGIAVSIGGAAVIVLLSSTGQAGKNNGLGLVYIIAQKVSLGSYPVVQKLMLTEFAYRPLLLVAWAYLIGTGLIGLTVAVAFVDESAWRISPTAAGAIVYAGVLNSFFNYSAMAFCNARTSPLVVTAFYPLQSILTPFLSSIFLGEDVTTADLYGGAIIVVGLFTCLYGRYLSEAGASAIVEESADAAVCTVALTREDVDQLAAAANASSSESLEDGGLEVFDSKLPGRSIGGGSSIGGSYGTTADGAAQQARAGLRARASFAEAAGPILRRALSRQLDAGFAPSTSQTHSGLSRRARLLSTASALRFVGEDSEASLLTEASARSRKSIAVDLLG
jgi:drug/metabolite transporter (DMT)-like permease